MNDDTELKSISEWVDDFGPSLNAMYSKYYPVSDGEFLPHAVYEPIITDKILGV